MSAQNSKTVHYSHGFQFRLRSLLLLTVVVSCVLAWVTNERRLIAQRREALPGQWRGGTSQPAWSRLVFGLDEPRYASDFTASVSDNFGATAAATGPGPSEITDANLVLFTGLVQLQSLSFARTHITDVGIAHLAGLHNLHYLNLAGTQVTDSGMVHVRKLRHLQTLILGGTRITDEALANIQCLGQLRELDLASTQVTDDGMTHIGEMTQVLSLNLDGTLITDSGLVHLKNLTHLKADKQLA